MVAYFNNLIICNAEAFLDDGNRIHISPNGPFFIMHILGMITLL